MIVHKPAKLNLKTISKHVQALIKPDTKKLEIDVDIFRRPIGVAPRAKVLFSNKALQKIKALVSTCDKEIGWRGQVERISQNEFHIVDVFVYPQFVTGATVSATDETELFQWLFQFPDEVFNNLRMQGHSHVRMGVQPSGVDTAFYEALMTQVPDYYIFMITNKNDAMYFEVHDIEHGVVYETKDVDHNYKVKPYENWAKEQIKEQLVERILKSTNNAIQGANTGMPRHLSRGNTTIYQGNHRTY